MNNRRVNPVRAALVFIAFGGMVFAYVFVFFVDDRQDAPAPRVASSPMPQTIALPLLEMRPATWSPSGNLILFKGFPPGKAEGKLTIFNGTSHHAIVKLIAPSGRKVFCLLVTARSSQVITSIPDGNYTVAFQLGEEVITGADHFYKPSGCSRFDQWFSFFTSQTDSAVNYTAFELTLNPVSDGKAKVSAMNVGAFDNL